MSDPKTNPGKTGRALVIEGGGAKGAYAFGALLAFKECGLHFDAVAGTSAGALNGLLWSTDSLQRGQAIWENLTFSSIYPVRILSSKSYPGWVIRTVASVYVFLHLLMATIEGIPNDLDYPLRLAIGLLFPAVFWVAPGIAAGGSLPFLMVSAVIYGFWFAWAMGHDEPRRRFRSAGRLYVRLLPAIVAGIWIYGLDFWARHSYRFVRISVAVVAWCFAMTLTNMIIEAFEHKFESITVLGRDGLAQEVRTIIGGQPIRIPSWATTAVYVELGDPDRASTYTDGAYGTRVKIYDTVRGTWIPHYSELSKLPRQQAIELCLASAALPFGIVPPVMIGDVKHVDGGVVDNCPIFPFIDNPDIDEVFVLSLKEGDKAKASFEKVASVARWKELRRTIDVFNYKGPLPVLSSSNVPPTNVPYREPQYVPRVISFHPTEKLGGMFKGTLNFTPDYAQRLIRQGRSETLSRLEELGLRTAPATVQV
jgi:predicted acylesterase/phospholipase RssA